MIVINGHHWITLNSNIYVHKKTLVQQDVQKKIIKVYAGTTQIYPDTVRIIKIYFSAVHQGSYSLQDIFDISEFEITAKYNDGTEILIDNNDPYLVYNINDGSTITIDTPTTLIAAYSGTDTNGKTLYAECVLDIPDGRELRFDEVDSSQYGPDDPFDPSKYKVVLVDPNGNKRDVTDDCTFNVGNDNITATYNDNGKTYTAETPINRLQIDEYGRYIRITNAPSNPFIGYGTIITRGGYKTFTVIYSNENGVKTDVTASCTHIYNGPKAKTFDSQYYSNVMTSNNDYVVIPNENTYTVRYNTGSGILEATITINIAWACALTLDEAAALLAAEISGGYNPCYIPARFNFVLNYSTMQVYNKAMEILGYYYDKQTKKWNTPWERCVMRTENYIYTLDNELLYGGDEYEMIYRFEYE